jgi:hypothetical protein
LKPVRRLALIAAAALSVGSVGVVIPHVLTSSNHSACANVGASADGSGVSSSNCSALPGIAGTVKGAVHKVTSKLPKSPAGAPSLPAMPDVPTIPSLPTTGQLPTPDASPVTGAVDGAIGTVNGVIGQVNSTVGAVAGAAKNPTGACLPLPTLPALPVQLPALALPSLPVIGTPALPTVPSCLGAGSLPLSLPVAVPGL